MIADAATHLGIAMANASKMFAPERVVLAVAPELDFAELTAGEEQAFRWQYVHENAPMPLFESMANAPATLARGAACTVLGRLFTADASGLDAVDQAG